MKFREGSTVEVLRRENGSHGSWFCGNIIAVDGDEYFVKYKLLMDDGGEAVVERVQKEDIRPQPLHQKGKRWMIGDVAEVFDIRCWRLGKVAKVFKNNRLVIKFFGSVQLKEFHVSNLRIQQAWHANNWSVIMKVQNNKQEARNFRHKTSRQSSSLVCNAPPQPTSEETCSADHKYRHNHLGVCTPSITMKRSCACRPEPSSSDLVWERILKKRPSSSDTGGCHRPSTRNHPLFRQVGHSTPPQVDEERKTVNKSTDIDSKIEKGTKNRIHNSFQPQCTEDSYQCSIASCNLNPDVGCPTGSSDKLMEDSSNSSDAESIFPALSSKKHLSGHKLKVDIHKLELEAYQSIVQAFHASGPLSWEQESLLTNLRLSLHISNEEHLLQLRHLLSAQVV